MANDAASAVRELNRIIDGLEPADELAEVTARAILDAAQAAGRRRPTPQAAMVSAAFRVDNEAIRGPSGTLGAIARGSEFGSTIYRQFGARHSGGSWLFPSVEAASVTAAQEAELDRLLDG